MTYNVTLSNQPTLCMFIFKHTKWVVVFGFLIYLEMFMGTQ